MPIADAALSPCGHYRWWLRRQWQPHLPALLFIGLNPSRADGQRDDPTLRRIVGFARRWGFGSVTVLNLFARISPSPATLKRSADPVGGANDRWLRQVFDEHCSGAARGGRGVIWLGWGNQGAWRGRDRQVLALMDDSVVYGGASHPPELLCLGLTAAGQPRHPLYVASATLPQRLELAQMAAPGASCDHRDKL